MSRTKNLIQLIESTEKHEFDEVVKAYIKAEFGFEKIINTDGKNDTGIDIKVFDFKKEKVQYQLTTQKSKTTAEIRSFESKLKSDLEKAKENFESYGYSNKLLFFYSYELKNKKIRDLEKLAFKDYGVDLEIIEANRLAEEAENHIEIQRILYHKSNLDEFHIKNSIFENEGENLIFDLLSFGKPSEFKIQIIEGFILKSIFENKILTKDEIKKLCEDKFKVSESETFYNKLISKLQSSRKILKESDSEYYTLTEDEKSLISVKVEQFQLDEEIFISEIENILMNYDQEANLDEFIKELKKLYIQNFSTELKELLTSGENEAIFGVVKDFIQFIDKKVGENDLSKKIGLELLKYCYESKFIQKVAASKVYIENINNPRLEKYLTTTKRLFIDTPIALYALCYYYKPKVEYDNYFFKITKNLIEFSKEENLSLNFSERYIWEVQNHIKEAYYLIPFSKLQNFQKLGSSRNVFYNFYIFLLNNKTLQFSKSFSDFLSEFGFIENISLQSLNSKINSHLRKMNIEKYELEYDYIIDEANRIFENVLISNRKFKSPFTRNNDSIMLEFLADDDVNIHPVQPVFLTWDKSFFDAQKEYFKSFPNCQKWLMLPPGKLIDSYSILKFKIDNESVTENLLALISDDLITNTYSLIDTIKFILNPNNETSLELTNNLAKIREEEIDNINRKVVTPPEDFEGEAVIDEVFYNLSNHFQEKEDGKLFNYFKEVFTKKQYLNSVIESIKNAIKTYYTTKEIDQNLYITFENFVQEIKKEKTL
jgi:hypothetical protein